MGDIERLDRRIDGVRDDVRGLIARLAGTGFSPGSILWSDTFGSTSGLLRFGSVTGANNFVVPFPGSLIAISVIAESSYGPGNPLTDYMDYTAYKNSGITGLTTRLAVGGFIAYAQQDKGIDTFAAGDYLSVQRTVSGTPMTATLIHQVTLWVSFS